ncbi:MAG: haloacid dehalogenase-like hydrolase [Halobacteriovoraceae bacterium]|nr:haloacid dehalogenase-like hydrolase [Halobacteriovoraceae bacterium]
MEKLLKELKSLSRFEKGKFINVFDADGTLWIDDIADEFALYLINCPKNAHYIDGSLWDEYKEMITTDPVGACAFYMKFFKNLSKNRFHELVYEWWENIFTPRWIAPVKKLLIDLISDDFEVIIVTGSPRLLFSPLLDTYKNLKVYGMEFKEDRNHIFTGEYSGILSAGNGKKEILESLGKPVFICVGNSKPDLPMLKMSEFPIFVGETDWHEDWKHPNKIIL